MDEFIQERSDAKQRMIDSSPRCSISDDVEAFFLLESFMADLYANVQKLSSEGSVGSKELSRFYDDEFEKLVKQLKQVTKDPQKEGEESWTPRSWSAGAPTECSSCGASCRRSWPHGSRGTVRTWWPTARAALHSPTLQPSD